MAFKFVALKLFYNLVLLLLLPWAQVLEVWYYMNITKTVQHIERIQNSVCATIKVSLFVYCFPHCYSAVCLNSRLRRNSFFVQTFRCLSLAASSVLTSWLQLWQPHLKSKTVELFRYYWLLRYSWVRLTYFEIHGYMCKNNSVDSNGAISYISYIYSFKSDT